jgi:transcriptional regulator with XRE-family HTH domain
VRFDSARFFRDVDQRRQDAALSWRQLGKELGISASTFSRMSQGKRPDVDTFIKLLAWLAVPAENYVLGAEATAQRRSTDTISAVLALLRADASLDPSAAEAIEDIVRVAYRRLSGTN